MTRNFLGLLIAMVTPTLHAQPAISNIILGGADRHCSSFNGEGAGRSCGSDWATILAQDPAFADIAPQDVSYAANYALPAFTYSLSAAAIARFRASPPTLFDPQRKALVLRKLQAALNGGPARLHVPFDAFGPDLTDGLTRAEVSVLRNAMVDALDGWQRKRELRSIAFAANPHVKANFLLFVEAARRASGGRTPLIGVVTASADMHPFADADINVFALRSAGAEVVYLPLEGGMRQALDRRDCDNAHYYYDAYTNTGSHQPYFHNHLVYPDLAEVQRRYCANGGAELNAVLGRISGLYFSGGDQARHLESFISRDSQGAYTVVSRQLQILRARHDAGELVVAGTSAGNHVQGGGLWRGKPVPMLAGGDSYAALRNGFAAGAGPVTGSPDPDGGEGAFAPSFYPLGGLGFFRFGVLDSHFSVRAREGRLTRLTLETGMDYGFGVDENTALVVSRPDAQGVTRFSVSGAGGVFIVDMRRARASQDPGGYAVAGTRAHYLGVGDVATIDAAGDLQVRLNPAAPVLAVNRDANPVEQDGVLDYGSGRLRALALRMGLQGAPQAFGSTAGSADKRSRQNAPVYRVTFQRDAQTEFRETPSGTADAARVSYTSLLLGFAPCAGPCTISETTTLPDVKK